MKIKIKTKVKPIHTEEKPEPVKPKIKHISTKIEKKESKPKFRIKGGKKIHTGEPKMSDDDTLAMLEEKLAKLQGKRKGKKKTSSKKSIVSGNVSSPSQRMKRIHKEWLKKANIEFNKYPKFKVDLQQDIDRIDIVPKENDGSWRLCAVGLCDSTVDVALYFKGKPDKMQTMASFNNINEKSATDVMHTLLTLKDTYSGIIDV